MTSEIVAPFAQLSQRANAGDLLSRGLRARGNTGFLLAATIFFGIAGSPLGYPITAPVPSEIADISQRIATPDLSDASDALLDRAGNLYVLDSTGQRLTVFARSGRLLTTAGIAGPRLAAQNIGGIALAIDDSDTIYLLDRIALELRKYRLRGKKLNFVGGFKTPTAMAGLCIVGANLYLLGAYNENIVHRYDLAGNYKGSFGSPYFRNSVVNESATASGYIACLPEARLVEVGTAMVGHVLAYSLVGTLRWDFSVPGFHQVVITERPDGTSQFQFRQAGPTDLILSLFRGSAGHTAGVQTIEVNGKAIRTFFVDPATGKLLRETDSLPHIRRTIRHLAIVIPSTSRQTVSVREWP